jgi:hypothetical protein
MKLSDINSDLIAIVLRDIAFILQIKLLEKSLEMKITEK